jgi:hypothetical protein
MGEKVKHLHHAAAAVATDTTGAVVEERARQVLPVLAQVLGVKYDDTNH